MTRLLSRRISSCLKDKKKEEEKQYNFRKKKRRKSYIILPDAYIIFACVYPAINVDDNTDRVISFTKLAYFPKVGCIKWKAVIFNQAVDYCSTSKRWNLTFSNLS